MMDEDRSDPRRVPSVPEPVDGRRAPVPKRKHPGKYRLPPRSARKGLLLIHTGDGKGKTTAALGILLRAAGRGMSVGMYQFIKNKSAEYGEHAAARKLGVEIAPLGDGFTWLTENIAEDKALALTGWTICRDAIRSGVHDILIFDELTYPLKFGWLNTATVIEEIESRAPGTHIVITGRDAPEELIHAADLVTEMRLIKHPYREQGIGAQPGLEL